ncbi:tubulin-tyrosine ligase [Novymonas esmeraldas]|uniref:Tubulin--tyrosine ligase-like protein 5 n=1 Tax=Novymonas esmeraldas TaxID=1808958 RepID=A0AAW0F9J5_9TRYP
MSACIAGVKGAGAPSSCDKDVARAVELARGANAPFCTPPRLVWSTSSAKATPAGVEVGLAEGTVYVVVPPFPLRRRTLAFVPCDTPATGDGRHRGRNDGSGDETAAPDDDVVLVQPDPLPPPACAPAADIATTQRGLIPLDPTARHGALSYIMDESCTPFTSLLATLRAAGFVRVAGRAALLHKTHSLLWVKHLLPSMVDQALQLSPPYRRVNHFPGTHALGRKDKLCLLLRRAGLRWRDGAGPTCAQRDARAAAWAALTPESWLLPQDAEECMRAVRQPRGGSVDADPLFIVKPTNQAGGRGIFLLRGGSEAAVATLLASGAALAEPAKCTHVVQRYMANPYVLDGRKFDLRLYVVVTSFDPVRLYLYREGLVRLAAAPYRRTTTTTAAAAAAGADAGASPGATVLADVDDLRAHLTNFTVSKAATAGEGQGEGETKWSLSSLEAYLTAMGHNWPATLERIHELLRRVFVSVTPDVRAELRASAARRARRTSSSPLAASPPLPPPAASSHATTDGTSPFFEIFGVDVLLTWDDEGDRGDGDSTHCRRGATLRPVLLEVNIMPSLSTHYSLFDQRVKANFIADVLTLVGMSPPPATHRTATAAAATGQRTASTAGTCEDATAGDAFLQSIADRGVLQVCLATEEERRRANNFTRLLPTRDSADKYASLTAAAAPESDAAGVAVAAAPCNLDAVLSAWLASTTM